MCVSILNSEITLKHLPMNVKSELDKQLDCSAKTP